MKTQSEQRLFNVELYWFAVLFNDVEQLKSSDVDQFRSPMREMLQARKENRWNQDNDKQLQQLTGVNRFENEKVNDAIAEWFGIVASCRKGSGYDYQELTIEKMRRKKRADSGTQTEV